VSSVLQARENGQVEPGESFRVGEQHLKVQQQGDGVNELEGGHAPARPVWVRAASVARRSTMSLVGSSLCPFTDSNSIRPSRAW